MSDDLVMRLRSNPTYDDISDAADLIDSQQDRIAELEAALREIRNLARTGKPHPMSRKTDYFQIASAALEGGKDE